MQALERTQQLPESLRLKALGVSKSTLDRWKRGTVHPLTSSVRCRLEALLAAPDAESYLASASLVEALRIITSAGPARTPEEVAQLQRIIRAAEASLPPPDSADDGQR